jgi:S1-C subfamily serine protease
LTCIFWPGKHNSPRRETPTDQISCPQCGAINRRGAKFCKQCGAHFIVETMKACPECGTPSPVDARACPNCHHVFEHVLPAVPPAPARTQTSRRGIVAVVAFLSLCLLGALAFVALPRTANPPPGSTATPSVRSALLAVVRVLVPMDSKPDYYSEGSGSIITRRGYILTNLHILRDSQTGRPYSSGGEIIIGITTDPNAPAKVTYRAKLVRSDVTNDLALLQINSLEDGSALASDLNLPVLPIGNSDRLGVGDQLTLLGYPGLGGDTITLTRGSVAGFLPDEGWIKTDAEISSGNSGGAAIDSSGELVGVPSAGAIPLEPQSVPGKLALVRPINLAQTLIDLAMRGGAQ